MIEFVPLEYYFEVWIYSALLITLFTLVHTLLLRINDSKNLKYANFVGYSLLILLILYIGLRPISEKYFTDMQTYARIYEHYASGGDIRIESDIVFHKFMQFCAVIIPTNGFFLLCAIIYVYPLYIVSKRFFGKYWFYCFFMFLVSFSFWSYGTNGIRNGMAASIFLLGLAYMDKKIVAISIFIISTFFHQTMLLPIGAYILTLFVNKPKLYLYGWLLAIPLSIALGSFWENLFASLGFADERLSGYLTGDKSEMIQNTGFRYDFLLYSSGAVFVGWYFIFKKKFVSPVYSQIYSIYLIANAFWILVIRANFSNRFAYLSWFMMALVVIYPYLSKQFFRRQHFTIGKVILVYFLFTFMMYLYYSIFRAPPPIE